MKNNKGITLISLLIYLIGMIVLIAIVSTVISFYNKNMLKLNNTSDISMELSKFETKMIKETQTLGNKIVEVTDTTIKFTSGNTYTFADDKIYQNTITVSTNVKEFLSSLETDGDKQILRIYILLGKGKEELVKNLSYVIEESY